MSISVETEIAKLIASIHETNVAAKGIIEDLRTMRNSQPNKPYADMTMEELIAARPKQLPPFDKTHK